MATFLAPVDKPRGLMLRLVYFLTRRKFGKVATPIAVVGPRMPGAFLSFYGKVSRLDKKLTLPARTAVLIREQVATINGCAYCMDAARWFALRESSDNAARLDALPHYRTSPLFTDAERAALDYASELTLNREVAAETFDRLRRYYSEREVCEVVWLVASEHLYNMSNIGLNIGSDGMCEVPQLAAP
jgi:alkylhydroperoxidase family enzyme